MGPDLPTQPSGGRQDGGRIIADRRVDDSPVGNLGRPGWDLQLSTTPRPRQPRPITPRSREPGPGPAHKRTTFCSRSIKFRAKDEVVLKYTTYSGNMRLYIQAVRVSGLLATSAPTPLADDSGRNQAKATRWTTGTKERSLDRPSQNLWTDFQHQRLWPTQGLGLPLPAHWQEQL